MVFSIYKNFSTNVKSRPPLVIFTVCLLGIIITSVCLAYYVHTHDKIVNSDAINDWISLLKYMNELDLCTKTTDGDQPFLSNKMQRDTSLTRITIPAKLLKFPINSLSHFQGFLPLADWSSKCPERTDIPSYIEVEFTVSKLNGTYDDQICVIITGPTYFMPRLSTQETCKAPEKLKTKIKWGSLNANVNHLPVDKFCIQEYLLNLQYDIDYNQNLKYDMFLSEEDRIMINSHLIVTSCFLVFVVILITCYALIRKTSTTITESKQHLMVKGMYL